jgi:hypothetical protein
MAIGFSFGDIATDVRIIHRAGVAGMSNFSASFITRAVHPQKTVEPRPLRIFQSFPAVSGSSELGLVFVFVFLEGGTREPIRVVRNPAIDSPIH